MVHAGEIGGLLDTILVRLAKHIEKAMKLKNQIKSAMVYPSAIIGVAVIVITILMIWVIPVFAKMFTEMSGGKVGLPAMTRFVIDLSNFMQSYIIYMALAAGGVLYGIKRYYATPSGRLVMDRLFLRLPIIGDLIRKASVAKFTRTLGTLITSGVPIMEGLMITAKTSGNKVVEEAILSARQGISGGKTLADPLSKNDVFPKMVTHMISVGESTGALDAMLGENSRFLRRRSRSGRCRADFTSGTHHDGIPWNSDRLYCYCHVPSHLQDGLGRRLINTIEKDLLLKALERSRWVKKKAARLLHLNTRSFRYGLEKYAIKGGQD